MWAAALDRLMGIVASSAPFPLDDIRAIAGSAQQHGSVYLNNDAVRVLEKLDPGTPLASEVSFMLARDTAPIWLDASTTAECTAIEAAVGGRTALAALTGSRACERFTGPQIRKWWSTDAEGYARTGRIHLVSSFLASLLACRHAPLDRADASGMNLMDLRNDRWSPAALDAVAPGLGAKLPPIAPSWTIAGALAPYWRARYGFPAANVVVWSGDNPCSLIGTGLVSGDRLGVSLGTSDTVFAPMDDVRIDASGCGHVFASALSSTDSIDRTPAFMGLTCFSNGSLAREAVRDTFGLDWTAFAGLLRQSPPGNRGGVMLPWFVPEITPAVAMPGVRRSGINPADAAANVRGVVEAQMMAMANHSQWIQPSPRLIHATGGAAANEEILRVMADVFDAPVFRFEVGNAACLGAALRAWHADALASGSPVSWEEVCESFVHPLGAPVVPIREHAGVYAGLRQRYAAFEASVVGLG
jgi:xylulokinase